MKLSIQSAALSLGLLWAGALLVVGATATLLGVHDGGYYGQDFLLAVASIYPGYKGVPGWGQALLGTVYGFVDGAVGGALLAWLYNACARRGTSAPAAS